MGADPIAIATSLISYQNGRAIKAFCIRKEPKKHGLKLWIEGNLNEKDNVIIIEDVITTGGSTIKAIERAKESNINVVSAIALIDREEGGKEAIEELGIHVESIFSKSDIMAFHNENK
jgi:orotate phosphoribosyltransferase